MQRLQLKPKAVTAYYRALEEFKSLGVAHETAVRDAFQDLLKECGRQFGWTLVPEWPLKRAGRHPLRVDGALIDEFRLRHGLWEAKDSADDLRKEARKKLELGYPADNIIFQSPDRAILYQNGREALDADLTDRDALTRALAQFFEYEPPAYREWGQAVEDFQTRIPEFGQALASLIERERRTNRRFREAFADFYELCRQSVNPNLSEKAVEEMLIQHLLTERIFRTVFQNSDFRSRNVIAREIERVIEALTSQAFSREEFLRRFDFFYRAVEETARTIEDFAQKQEFLNAVYERFFRGFSVKVADTHGIVYTPPSIVSFMVRSVEHVLAKEFGKSLGSAGVHILDPFVGTGNFIVHCMEEIKKSALEHKYRHELHCNEVMLLPYYVASMNIEHEFYERTGRYESFEGICLVDTFELAEEKQMAFFSTANTDRVERQKRSPIFVIIGNPPYNVGQVNENDNNKNRKYPVIDRRVAETYGKSSSATLKSKLSDPYVKAIRWASDRIKKNGEGVVAFVTNNSFLDNKAFDGMRKELARDFSKIFHINLKGNARTSGERRRREGGNVFDDEIRVSVGITFFIKKRAEPAQAAPEVWVYSVGDYLKSKAKLDFLNAASTYTDIPFSRVKIDEQHTWLTEGMNENYHTLIPLGSKGIKQQTSKDAEALFKLFSLGVSTNRDATAYDFEEGRLAEKVEEFCNNYNTEVIRYQNAAKVKDLDSFLNYSHIKWSDTLKRTLRSGRRAEFIPAKARIGIYRPFAKRHLFYAEIVVDRPGLFRHIFPSSLHEEENRLICVSDVAWRSTFSSLMTNVMPDLHLCASVDAYQCFPFYVYDEDGSNRRENITDWALGQFREHYGDKKISKWDIFHYVYAVLHHPAYRERYAANLKRELPRIPFAPDFRAFAAAGSKLAELHVNYERQPEYPLERIENPAAALNWRVERMRLSKDHRTLVYNDFLTLSNIPEEVFDYRLGNRSALEWVIDQHQVTTDRRSQITNDPNRPDDPQYILRLVGQVVHVSLETVRAVRELPQLGVGATDESFI